MPQRAADSDHVMVAVGSGMAAVVVFALIVARKKFGNSVYGLR